MIVFNNILTKVFNFLQFLTNGVYKWIDHSEVLVDDADDIAVSSFPNPKYF